MKNFASLALAVILAANSFLSVAGIPTPVSVETTFHEEISLQAENNTEATLNGTMAAGDVDAELGTLVYYNNFENDEVGHVSSKTKTMLGRYVFDNNSEETAGILSDVAVGLTFFEGYLTNNTSVQTVATQDNASNKALQVINASGWRRIQLDIKDANGLAAEGTYTLLADWYITDTFTGTANFGHLWNSSTTYRCDKTISQNTWGTSQTSYTVDGTTGKEALKNVTFQNLANGVSGDIYYIDNIRLYFKAAPASCEITVDLGEGIDYATFNVSGEYIVTGETMKIPVGNEIPEIYIPGKAFLGWYNSEGVRVLTAPQENVTLTAKWRDAISVPGLNLLTGTTGALDFEAAQDISWFYAGNNMTSQGISVIATDDNAQNKAFHAVSTAGGNITSQLNLPIVTEVGRYYQVTFDTYVTRQYGMQGFYGIGVSNNNQVWGAIAANTWKHYDTKVSANKTGNPYTLQYNTNGSSGSTSHGDYYIDNISIIPYYQVTYVSFDGTENVKPMEQLLPSDGIITIDKDVAPYGVYLEANGTGALYTDTITLDNKDLTLYVNETAPTQKTILTLELNGHESATDITGTVITSGSTVEVLSNSLITLEPYVAGYTFMGWYDVNDNKVTVATGDSMTLKAKWQAVAPGLNILSGTTAVYDFEDGTRQLFAAGNNIISTGVSVIATDENSQNKAFHAVSTAGGNISAQLKLPIVTEVGRYYQVTFDTYVTRQYGMQGFYGIGVSNANQVWTTPAVNTWTHQNQKVASNKTGNPYILQYNTNGSSGSTSHGDYYIDNISIIPYYQVTYVSFDGTENVKPMEQLLPSDGIITIDTTVAPYGVYLEANGTGALYTDTITLDNKDLTLYVNETAPIQKTTLTFDLNGYDSAIDIKTPGSSILNGASVQVERGSVITAEPYVAGFTFMGWYDTNDSKVTVADGEEMALKAKWQAVAPGLNMLSGTAAPYDFEDGTRQLFTAGSYVTATGVDVIANDSNTLNKAFVATMNNKGSVNATLKLPVTVTGDRYYDISFDTYTARPYGAGGIYGMGICNNNLVFGSLTKLTWKHAEHIKFGGKASSELTLQFNMNGSTNDSDTFYIDNISIVPYYHITYKTFDDALVAEEFVLPSDNIYHFNSELVSKYGADGFYLSKDSDEKLTSTTLQNTDLTLYVDVYKPTTFSKFSIRTTTPQALRFAGFSDNEMHAAADEYGFVIARKDALVTAGGEEYKTKLHFGGFTEGDSTYFTNSDNVLCTYGKAYDKTASFDKTCIMQSSTEYFGSAATGDPSYTGTGAGHYFAAALINIPESAYNQVLCGRTYIRIGNNYFYGEVVEASIYDIALKIQNADNFQSQPEAYKNTINNIVSLGSSITE